jgi:hypothetical protein
MKLPEDALIAREKLTHYLLVFQQDSDKSKFLAQAGFTQANPEALELAIRQMIATHEAVFDSHNRYGDFYRVEGTLQGVNNHDLLVVTIWIMRSEEDGLYRFVTLKPLRKIDNAT